MAPTGQLRWSAHPAGYAVCRDHVQDPAFAPGTSEVAAGFWPFCILFFIICPNCTCMQLVLVPYSFFVFCSRGDVCPGASTPVKGPRSQPASVVIDSASQRQLKLNSAAWAIQKKLSLPYRAPQSLGCLGTMTN